MAEKQKVVFDAGVVLQATLHPNGPANRALRFLDAEIIEAYLSPHTREEIEDVLARPAIRRKYPRLGDGRAEAMLARLDNEAHLVASHFHHMSYPRDPNDEPVINLAIHVRADYIVARDNDLLDLGRSRDFRLLYPFIRIVDPVTFLQEIEQKLEQGEQPAPSEKPEPEGGEGEQ